MIIFALPSLIQSIVIVCLLVFVPIVIIVGAWFEHRLKFPTSLFWKWITSGNRYTFPPPDESLTGAEGVVEIEINNTQNPGRVKLKTFEKQESWGTLAFEVTADAKSQSRGTIPVGTEVTVVLVEDKLLVVTPKT